MNDSERLVAHCARLPRGVLYDEETAQLLDLASGKTLKLPASSIQSIVERTDDQSFRPSLSVLLEDGRALALVDSGISFAPLFTHTGPLEELPARVGWGDFRARVEQLKLELYGPSDTALGTGTVRILMGCLAIVDGARAVGFEVAEEERELEWHLKELERRAPS